MKTRDSKREKLPAPVHCLLRVLLEEEDCQEFSDDLIEASTRMDENGSGRSRFWILVRVLESMPGLLWDRLMWRFTMLKNYARSAFRSMKKQKTYSLINILGLSIGMSVCMLIMLWVHDELSYDQFHTHKERLYRINSVLEDSGSFETIALSPFVAAAAFKESIPEIELFTTMHYVPAMFAVEDRVFEEEYLYSVDPDFFSLFSHPFLSGDPLTALSNSGSVVLTESLAIKIFGRTDILGSTFQLNQKEDVQVTGVIRDVPGNTHMPFLALVSNHTDRMSNPGLYDSWGRFTGWSYLLLRSGSGLRSIEEKMNSVAYDHLDEADRQSGYHPHFELIPVTDIHLKSSLIGEMENNGSMRDVILFSMIAGFVLLIACFNFINLNTARSMKRSKEVGIRKVLGAHRIALVRQFMAESLIMVLLSAVLAVLFITFAFPGFNTLTLKTMDLSLFKQGSFWIFSLCLIFITSLLSGVYPSLFISSLRPILALKETQSKGARGTRFRQILVIFQFLLSLILMAATLLILRQARFLRSRELGFDKEQRLFMTLKSDGLQKQAQAFKQALLTHSGIQEATVSYGIPGHVYTSYRMVVESSQEQSEIEMNSITADYDFLETYGIPLLRGRNFSEEFPTDKEGVYIVNESAVRKLGLENVLGIRIGLDPSSLHPIIGVVKDFHFESLRNAIEPLVIQLSDRRIYNLTLQLRTDDLKGVIAFIESTWKRFEPYRKFEYRFVDEEFERFYRYEDRISGLTLAAALLAVFVSCLGLFGLASHTAEQRIKEIGIRKILGASSSGVVLLLARNFTLSVIIANCVSWPLIYLFARRFLQGYAYRIPLDPTFFLIPGLLTLLVALATVCAQSIRAASRNPAESLRYE